ncbi:hypothetical protein HELRODRAFT_166102 [Helobdella robusta]|uniref:L-lactate dehydrogenase n=1 Tax=Helobdella robusta TaxID=6412 RepID=T1EXR7_HELRO|nr:hypothetical protein HELRODRAFT_166102 [Helobdella robusta]ESN90436.1 hypothetical protein HELRODRAFT_166102 [Helobdella robusta]
MADCANSESAKRGPTFTKMIYKELVSETKQSAGRVTVVGVGAVGMASAFSLLAMGICNDLCLVDARKEICQGEQLDLMHGLAFYGKRVAISGDSDYGASANSKIVVLTAGARQAQDESRLDLVGKNVTIFKSVVPQVIKYSPSAILIVVTNPCDIMAWVAWKISGLPKHKVIGTGTLLDSSRFRYMISERLGVAPHSVHAYIIGEHGDSSVPVWSSVNVAGTRLKDLTPTIGENPERDPENWDQVHKTVVGVPHEIIKLKGFTNWGIGMMVSRLCEAILRDQRTVYPVSTQPDGWSGIYDEVFISIPCIVGSSGISHIINMNLDPPEQKAIQESARMLRRVIDTIKL